MGWFYNLRIGKKIILGFMLIALMAGMVGYVGITRIKIIESSNHSIEKQQGQVQNGLSVLAQGFERKRVLLKDMVICKDSAQLSKDRQSIAVLDKEEKEKLAEMKNSLSGTALQASYKELCSALDQYAGVKDEYLRLVETGQIEKARLITSVGSGVQAANAVYTALDNFGAALELETSDLQKQNRKVVNQAVQIMLTLIIVNLALALILGFFISRIINRPLKAMLNAANRLSVGDVKVKVDADSNDEIGSLARAFSAMIENVLAQARVAEHLAAGDMDIEVGIRSEEDLLGHKLNEVLLNLRLLVEEISRMYQNQKAGDIEAMIPVEKFQGAYRDLAEGVNQVVELHVKNILAILDILGSYAEGDFAPVMAKLPGKQAAANEKMDLLRENLLAVINEIANSTRAAIQGQLSQRADAAKYPGDYGKIIAGLNEVMAAAANPISEINSVLQAMAEGRLNKSMEGMYAGDYSEIQAAINNTIKAFNKVLGEINQIAEQVALGSEQVAESSQALSQASTEQAASVQEITATMNEVASQTRQNAVNANQASEMAGTVKENAVYGNREMQEMLNAMSEINDASNKISKIIKVIDEIAYQTNILALNAAVEAARAGQHGKGFAVVAEEVRNLAARSANAAKETTAMIEGSIAKVGMGTRIANETAQALNKINDGVSSVADLIIEIAIASNDQAAAINQVNIGIAEISEVTQMNTANSEESAAASEELANKAELLKQRVGRFELEGSHAMAENEDFRPGNAARSYLRSAEKPGIPAHPKRISINLDPSEFK